MNPLIEGGISITSLDGRLPSFNVAPNVECSSAIWYAVNSARDSNSLSFSYILYFKSDRSHNSHIFVLNVSRLSVDIDLNYVGAVSRKAMLEERPRIEAAVQSVLRREGFTVRQVPKEHAGGKWSFPYASAFRSSGRLGLDLNRLAVVSRLQNLSSHQSQL